MTRTTTRKVTPRVYLWALRYLAGYWADERPIRCRYHVPREVTSVAVQLCGTFRLL